MRILILLGFALSTIALGLGAQAQPSLTKKSVEERLAELEANQSLRYINFSGFLISSYDNVSVDENFPTKSRYNDLNYLRMRFSLNIDAEVSPQIRLYTRFTAAKFMNNWRTQGGSPYFNEDIEGTYSYPSSHLMMEKAYVDLSSPDSFWTVSVGRLPTVNGTPAHLLDLLPRQGTYPLLSFNAPLDGIAVTYRLDSLLPADHEWAVRGLYTPFSDLFWGTSDRFLRPPANDTNGNTPVGAERSTLANMFSLQSDYTVKDHPLFEQMGTIWQYYRTGPLHFSSGNGTSNLSMQSSNMAATFEANGILRTGLDLSLNYTLTELVSEGFFTPGMGVGTDQDYAVLRGGRSLLAARYRFKDWAVGMERVDGDRYAYNYSGASEDLTGFYQTPGIAHHVYVVTKLMSLVTLRAGYRDQELRSFFPRMGPIRETDRSIKTFYVTLRTDF